MFYEEVFRELNKSKVKYLVAGGVAVNLYGVERLTHDLDLVVWLERSNLDRFINAAKRLGLRPKVPVKLEDFSDPKNREKWCREKNMIVFQLYHPKDPFLSIDVMINVEIDFTSAYRRRNNIRLGKLLIPLLSIRDLVKLKQKANRPQDIADIYYLQKIAAESGKK